MNADQVLTLTLTAGELNVVLAALNEVPYRLSAPVIEKLHRQVLAADPTAFAPATGLNGSGLVEPTASENAA